MEEEEEEEEEMKKKESREIKMASPGLLAPLVCGDTAETRHTHCAHDQGFKDTTCAAERGPGGLGKSKKKRTTQVMLTRWRGSGK